MFAEHIVYSAALAILVGMVFYRYTGRDSSWIIIVLAWAPDLDELDDLINLVLRPLGIRFFQHGTFHNVFFMVIFGIVIASLLRRFGMKFPDALFFSLVGFGAHLLEDALVYMPYYRFLWPFSSQPLGLGLLPTILNGKPYSIDFFHIANTEVLIIGVLLLLGAILIRTLYERSLSWVRWYMPGSVYEKYFRKTPPGTMKK
jgi:membrane-bound metal-dependent hydrolase YbcI (DUF457 family)